MKYFVQWCLSVVVFDIVLGIKVGYTKIKPNILGPPLPHRPFIVAWDVSSDRCERDFGVQLNLSDFDIVYNPNKGWRGDSLVIFYSDQLGIYPKFDPTSRQAINGGIPQNVDLYAHLDKAAQDIVNFIPDPKFKGMAVIDWEAWHPLWNRMTWGILPLYQNKSIEKVQAEHPDWTPNKILAEAKSEYKSSARTLMDFTLSLGKLLRPQALWGFYLYPDCYNYDKDGQKKDLRCSNQTLQMNNEIQWVFDKSTALYPSVYLGEWFSHKKIAVDYVAYRVIESLRVDENRPNDVSVPILVYHLLTYRKQPKFLDLFDLRDSIGVASLLGASGMVIWGDGNVAKSVETCQNLSDYISNTLGPYVKATLDAAAKCSSEYCNANGRCVVSPLPDKGSSIQNKYRYLVYDEAKTILKKLRGAPYRIFDKSLQYEAFKDKYSITCQCYNDWSGKDCAIPEIWR